MLGMVRLAKVSKTGRKTPSTKGLRTLTLECPSQNLEHYLLHHRWLHRLNNGRLASINPREGVGS